MEYCKDCNDTLEHMHEVDVDPNGWTRDARWFEGPNNRMHFRQTRRPSNKYPTPWALDFLCGRRAPTL